MLANIAQTVGYISTLAAVAVFLWKLWKIIKGISNGQLCVLRTSITAMYYRHVDEEKPTLREYERKNLDDLFDGYKALGGNHFIDDLYETMREWKVTT